MTNEYDLSLATPDDVSGIIALQEPNLPANGGTLSVRQPADWFTKAILEKSVVVARRNGKVVGYVLGTSLAAKAHIPIIQAMLSVYPAPSECYLYGPVCIAESERGKGVALALFEVLQKHMAGRPAMAFVRTDNAPSRRAHKKMGMRELGIFQSEDVPYVALAYTS
jgi:RimJ/RimL family protein N-acetyltransferase